MRRKLVLRLRLQILPKSTGFIRDAPCYGPVQEGRPRVIQDLWTAQDNMFSSPAGEEMKDSGTPLTVNRLIKRFTLGGGFDRAKPAALSRALSRRIILSLRR
jgi:hypothetical protein